MSLLKKKNKAARLGLDSGEERGSLTNRATHRTLGGGGGIPLPTPPQKKKITVHTVMRGMSQWGKLEWKLFKGVFDYMRNFLTAASAAGSSGITGQLSIENSWGTRYHKTAVHRGQLGLQTS
jgi:hypothetical protein